jgi:hypothetical protein
MCPMSLIEIWVPNTFKGAKDLDDETSLSVVMIDLDDVTSLSVVMKNCLT